MLILVCGAYVNPTCVTRVWVAPPSAGTIVQRWTPTVELVNGQKLFHSGQDKLDVAEGIVEAIVGVLNRASGPGTVLELSPEELVAEHRGDESWLRDRGAVAT